MEDLLGGDLDLRPDARGNPGASAARLGQEGAAPQVVVHGLHRLVQPAEDQPQVHLRREDRLAGSNHAFGRRRVWSCPEVERRGAICGEDVAQAGVQVELEAVAARPGKLPDEVLAGGVIAQHEPGVAVAIAPVAPVHPVACLGQVVPVEIALADRPVAVEVAHRNQGFARISQVRLPALGLLEHAAPGVAGCQRRRSVAAVRHLQPARQHRRSVEQRMHLQGHPAQGVAQRDDDLQSFFRWAFLEPGPFPIRRQELPVEFHPEGLGGGVLLRVDAPVVEVDETRAVQPRPT